MIKAYPLIFILIILLVFSVPSIISSAKDISGVSIEKINEYLELSQKDAQQLLNTLIQIFTNETIDLEASGYSTNEERAVPVILRKAARIEVLNHLLTEAPLEVMQKIIKGTIDISRIILLEDISAVIEKLEQESVKKAVEYGMEYLLQKEIRVTPGIINFRYVSQAGNKKEIIIQYLIVYKPLNLMRGKVLIRFYSPNSIDPPQSNGSIGYTLGAVYDLRENLPPFIVDIEGEVQKTETDVFAWTEKISVDISFPEKVPDLGIKPLSLFERYVLRPLESKIKEIEIIITRISSRPLGVAKKLNDFASNIFEKIKSIKIFGGASMPINQEGSLENNVFLVKKVIDGDTIELENGEFVRYLGMDTPEKDNCFYKEATERNRELVEGKKVKLEKDVTDKDVYGRILRYVYIDSIFVNDYLLRNGYAKLLIIPPAGKNHKDEFKVLEQEAANNKLGLWGPSCPPIAMAGEDKTAELNEDIYFDGSKSNDNTKIISYKWDVNLNNGVNFTNPDLAGKKVVFKNGYSYPGSYVVTLEVTDSSLNSSIDKLVVNVNPKPKLLITEVQIYGKDASDDFVKIYNESSFDVDISDYQLKKKTSTGKDYSIVVFPKGSVIRKKGYFIWANSSYDGSNFDVKNSGNISSNNSIAILDRKDNALDALAWGENLINPYVETLPFPKNPDKDQLLRRKWNENAKLYYDINNNKDDFEIVNFILKEEEKALKTASSTVFIPCRINEIDLPMKKKVIINEVSWMGGINSSSHEWIELKNISYSNINLSNWQLIDNSEKIKIAFKEGLIERFYLLERTSDNSVPGIKADFIYSGALKNSDESLYLFDENCVLQDKILANPAWPAGDNESKRTMERKSDLSWQTSLIIGGTPKQENTSGYTLASYENVVGPSLLSSEKKDTSSCIKDSSNPLKDKMVIINEVAWMGSSSSSADEWIELKNISTSTISLGDFQLLGVRSRDNETSIKVFFGEEDFMPPNSFFLLERTDDNSIPGIEADKIFTNSINDSDFSLFLFDNECELLDEVNATSSWPAGSKEEKKTMERDEYAFWHTSYSTSSINGLFGTPKAENSKIPVVPLDIPEENASLLIVINEIAWAGTKASYSDEWIELYNNTTSSVDLSNWTLKGGGDTPSILFSTSTGTTTIQANGFYLLERTNGSTTSIKEERVFTGELNNDGERLELRDGAGNLIDAVYAIPWFAGTKTPNYISMERINSASSSSYSNWASNNLVTRNGKDALNNNINGTPRAKNSVSYSSTTIINLPFEEFEDITLTYLGNPYIIQNTINVPASTTLKIEKGVKLMFGASPYGTGMKINGTLKAIGEEQKLINFTTNSPYGYFWCGIEFSSSSVGSEIDYSVIEYGSSCSSTNYPDYYNDNHYVVRVNNTSVNFNKVSFNNNKGLKGIHLLNSFSSISNSSFVNFDDFEFSVAIYAKGGNINILNSYFSTNSYGIIAQNNLISLSGNIFNKNKKPIYLQDSKIIANHNEAVDNNFNGILIQGTVHRTEDENVFLSGDLPYIVEQNISVPQGKTLTIDEGTIAKFNINRGSYLSVDGTLLVNGSPLKPVIFTSLYDNLDDIANIYGERYRTNTYYINATPTPGSWDSIYLNSSSSNSVLNNAVIRYGGRTNNPKKGALYIEKTNVLVTNSVIDNNLMAGIELQNSSSTIQNTTFKNNNGRYQYNYYSVGLWVGSNALLNITNSTFSNNYYGIYWPSGGISCSVASSSPDLIFENNTYNCECACCAL